jgi:putative hemolysin
VLSVGDYPVPFAGDGSAVYNTGSTQTLPHDPEEGPIAWMDLLIILLLTLAHGLFAASEIAVISARRGRLVALAASGHRAAQQVLMLANHPERLLAAVQVGITLIGTFAAPFGGACLDDVLAAQLRSIGGRAPYADSLALAPMT